MSEDKDVEVTEDEIIAGENVEESTEEENKEVEASNSVIDVDFKQVVEEVKTGFSSTNAIEVRDKLIAFCRENNLDYIIAGGRFVDSKPEEKNVTRLIFHSEILGEASKDSYVTHNWLMKTGLDVTNYARKIVDMLVHRYQLITIPADKVKPVTDDQLTKITKELLEKQKETLN